MPTTRSLVLYYTTYTGIYSKWDIGVDRENNNGKLICAVLITMKVSGYYQQHHHMAWKHEKMHFHYNSYF